MNEERGWRDAKIPKWAAEAIQAEIDQWRLTAALSWPQEPKPAPVPFFWGDYDHQKGEAVEGKFWRFTASHNLTSFFVAPVHIRRTPKDAESWKSWQFSLDGKEWTTNVVRGCLYASEHDARLAGEWASCERAAKFLMMVRA